jgi:phosphate transport system permease protein
MKRDFKKLVTRRRREDAVFKVVGLACTVFGLVVLTALLADLAIDGLKRIDWQFLTSFPSRKAARAGILSAWVGSLVVMFVTGAVGIPLGVAAGVYLEEYAKKNKFTEIIELNIANLAGVPSIVYGLMALGLFVYQFNLGQSVLAAGLTLALLILPIIIVATREALRAIPNTIREAAAGLGASKWQMVRDHLLPYSMGGISTGIIIAMSRAIGETAPLVTIGAMTFIAFLPPSPISAEPLAWLHSPFTVLPIQMFNWVSRPTQDFHHNAAATGLVLIAITIGMNAVAIFYRYRLRKRIKW